VKIAVLRANGLGDLVFSLPALEALRARYRDAEIVLLGAAWAARLLMSRPGPVDRVVPVPPGVGLRDEPGGEAEPAGAGAFFRRMRAERFDLALQMHGGGRSSNPFVSRLGARETVGHRSPDAAPLDRWLPYVYLQPEILRYLELVALLGAEPVTLAPRLAVTDDDRAAAARALGELGPFAVLHPGATDARRRWPAQRFAEVGDELAARGLAVLIVRGPRDAEPGDRVARAMRAPARQVSLHLGGLVGVLSAARVVVANDSGPLHLAAAVGAPTVGLFWGANIVGSVPPWRSRHRPLGAFDVACPVCGTDNLRDRCGHAVSFVERIPVDEVVAAAAELLDAPPAHRGALERALDPRAAAGR